MRTEFIMNIKQTSEGLNSTLWLLFIMQVCSTSQDSMLLVSLAEWTDGPDMIGILTCKSTFRNCHQLKSFRLYGMELQSSSGDWPRNKSNRKMSTRLKQFWIKAQKLSSHLQERQTFWSVLLSVLTWVVSQSPIWETTTATCVSATVQSMTNSAESDKAQPFKISLTLTTQFTKMEP